jgi:SAM-dependent methyltransferase
MRVLVVNPPNKPYSSSSLLIEPIDVLTVAREKVNAKFLCSSAESIDLPDESLDVVISTWVVGTIQGVDRKAQAINEATRVLRKGGSIYLVENDLNGDFEYIRNRYPNVARTKAYNGWLENEMGFVPVSRFETYFGFDSLDEARLIIGSIWGEEASLRVSRKDIGHNIVIYEKRK